MTHPTTKGRPAVTTSDTDRAERITDLQRAAAYIEACARDDHDAMAELMREADEGGRLAHLLAFVAALCKRVAPEVFTEAGAQRVAAAVARSVASGAE